MPPRAQTTESRPSAREYRPGGPPGTRGAADASAPEPEGADRLLIQTETGFRWFVQALAIALWVPAGFVFWIPLLLRRTVAYVFSVLEAGLTEGTPDRAGERLQHAVAFYRLGFQRILHLFRPAEERPGDGPDRGSYSGEVRAPRTSWLVECAWAAGVWTVLLWITGIWPDAPATVGSAVVEGWEAIGAWIQEFARQLQTALLAG